MNNKEWRIEAHESAIADTGDYDCYYELTNGDISLVTRDEIDEDEEMRAINAETEDTNAPCVKVLVSCLNQLDCKWENWIEDDIRYQLHVMSENCDKWKNIADILYDNLKHGFSQEALEKDLETYEKLKMTLP